MLVCYNLMNQQGDIMHKIKRALISVSDKTGIVDFAKQLDKMGIEILSTGGTKKALEEAGVSVKGVSEFTGSPEMLDGRVKTLHPKIHGGLLAVRSNKNHMRQVEEYSVPLIDIVVVNLYPFQKTITKENVSLEEAIENIDIGGPTMLRSAAKNHKDVVVVTDPDDYVTIIDELKNSGEISLETKQKLAVKVFRHTADYDSAIDKYLSENLSKEKVLRLKFTQGVALRYGENSHQLATFYMNKDCAESNLASAKILHGKEMSYNNYVDANGALEAAKDIANQIGAVVVKHTNPCGYATGKTLREAVEKAWMGDPISAFGSIVAVTRKLDLETAEFLKGKNAKHLTYTKQGDRYVPEEVKTKHVEVIIAPGYDRDALELLKSEGKVLRILEVAPLDSDKSEKFTYRKIVGGILEQDRDLKIFDTFDIVTKALFPDDKKELAKFAYKACKHTKSNAIVLCREYAPGCFQILGMGAGQPNRVDSLRKLAIPKAMENLQIEYDMLKPKGSLDDYIKGVMSELVLASDAFFPFSDTVEEAASLGIKYIIQPGGSKRDDASISKADELGISMVFTGMRHFLH